MKLALEVGPDPKTVKLWWKDSYNDQEYGEFVVLPLPCEDFQKELDILVNGRYAKMTEVIEGKK